MSSSDLGSHYTNELHILEKVTSTQHEYILKLVQIKKDLQKKLYEEKCTNNILREQLKDSQEKIMESFARRRAAKLAEYNLEYERRNRNIRNMKGYTRIQCDGDHGITVCDGDDSAEDEVGVQCDGDTTRDHGITVCDGDNSAEDEVDSEMGFGFVSPKCMPREECSVIR